MRHRRTYLPAGKFVDYMVRKHSANRAWIWEILEEDYNIIRGIGGIMTIDERMRTEHKIVRLMKEGE